MYYSDKLPQFNSKKEIKQQKEKPFALPVKAEGIPLLLQSLNQWVCWRWEIKDNEWTKVPINVRTKGRASSTDPNTWVSCEAALISYNDTYNNLDGIGFVFKEGSELTGIDFDECRYTDGSTNQTMLEWIEQFQSYTELSPSAGGYKIWCKVNPQIVASYRNKVGHYEAYNRGRYFAVTGHGEGEIREASDVFVKFASSCLGLDKEKASNPSKSSSTASSQCEGAEYRFRLMTAFHDEKFKSLFNDAPQEGRHSESVQSLLFKIAFYFGESFEIADKLFRLSALWCDKWSEGKWERLGEKEWAKATYCQQETYTLPSDWQIRLAEVEGLPRSEIKIEEIDEEIPTRNEPLTTNEIWGYSSKTKSLIPNVLLSGSHTLLSAREKKGKTFWVNQLIVDILANGEAFGQIVNPLPIYYLDFEMGLDLFKFAYFSKIYPRPEDKRNASVQKYFRYCSHDGERLPLCLSVEWLSDLIKKHDKGIIVVDSIRGAFSTSPILKGINTWENDAGAVGKLLRPITAFCHERKWNIISIHHNNKGGNYSGSTEFGASLDAIWEFNQVDDTNSRTIDIVGRGVNGKYTFNFENDKYNFVNNVDTSDKAIRLWVVEQFKNGPLTQKELLKRRGIISEDKVRNARSFLQLKLILIHIGKDDGFQLAPNYQELMVVV